MTSLGTVWRAAAVTIVALGGAVAGTTASAQTSVDEQRIEFDPGTDNATREGRVDVASADRWILSARAGQLFELTVDSADENIAFAVFAPDRTLLGTVVANATVEESTFWSGVLPVDGDYAVEVTSLSGGAFYRMKVWIDAGYKDPLGMVSRMTFAPGTSSGSASGAVVRASEDTWLLNARAGQRMDVTVASLEANSTFDVFAPDGTGMTATDDRTTWTGQLPQDGDYRVVVRPVAGNATYTITVTITGGGPTPSQTPPPPAPPAPPAPPVSGTVERVSFAPGTDHATIYDSIGPGITNSYLLGAAEGQVLTVFIQSDIGGIVASAFDPFGEPLRVGEYEFSVEGLSTSGDYEVTVTNENSIVGAYELWIYIT